MTRLLRLAALVGVLAFVPGCGGGSSVTSGEPVSFQQLASSATTSAKATSGRFAFAMEMTVPEAPEPFAFSGEGAFDSAAKRGALSLDLSSFGELLGGFFAAFAAGLGADAQSGADLPDFGDPSLWKLEVVQDGTVAYMRLPAMAEGLPAGKSWVRVDNTKATTAQGFDFSEFEQLTENDPREMLRLLEAVSGSVETVGTESLRGTETTHYRATVDLGNAEKLAPDDREELRSMFGDLVEEFGVSELPVDVWLDASGMVRKLAMSIEAAEPGTAELGRASVTFELWDYGETVEIELPPADQVVDESTLSD